jgi:hypothetical protein
MQLQSPDAMRAIRYAAAALLVCCQLGAQTPASPEAPAPIQPRGPIEPTEAPGARPLDPRVLANLTAKRAEVFAECAQRHMFLGSWARKAGLVPQATREFFRAVEVGEGHNAHAHTLIHWMRSYGPRFWRGERTKFTRGLLQNYTKRREGVDEQNLADRYAYARLAHRAGYVDEALSVFRTLLRERGHTPLTFDKKGRIELAPGPIPEDLTAVLTAEAVTIDDAVFVRDAAAERDESLADDLARVADDDLIVRGSVARDVLANLHAAASLLVPQLEDRLHGRPDQRLELLVLATRTEYEACLGDRLAGFAAASGVADYETMSAILCAEGLAADHLLALALHELTHLFDVGVVPVVMPAWYREGLAESFGAHGSFRIEREHLTVGDPLPTARIDALKEHVGASTFDFAAFLATDPGSVFDGGADNAATFYLVAWAFDRFLRADPERAATYEAWETACRGGALGVDPGLGAAERSKRLRAAKAVDADAAFLEAFGGKDGVQALATSFRAFVADL